MVQVWHTPKPRPLVRSNGCIAAWILGDGRDGPFIWGLRCRFPPQAYLDRSHSGDVDKPHHSVMLQGDWWFWWFHLHIDILVLPNKNVSIKSTKPKMEMRWVGFWVLNIHWWAMLMLSHIEIVVDVSCHLLDHLYQFCLCEHSTHTPLAPYDVACVWGQNQGETSSDMDLLTFSDYLLAIT